MSNFQALAHTLATKVVKATVHNTSTGIQGHSQLIFSREWPKWL